MAGTYDRGMKVSQATIDHIKKMGMTEAIRQANSGSAGAEFTEAARRMYGGNRVSNTVGEPTAEAPKEKAGPSSPSKAESAPAAEAPKTQPISSVRPASIDKKTAALRSSAESAQKEYAAKGRGGGREKAAKSAGMALNTRLFTGPARQAHAKKTAAAEGKAKSSEVESLNARLASAKAELSKKGSGRGREGRVKAIERALTKVKKPGTKVRNSLSDSSSFL